MPSFPSDQLHTNFQIACPLCCRGRAIFAVTKANVQALSPEPGGSCTSEFSSRMYSSVSDLREETFIG